MAFYIKYQSPSGTESNTNYYSEDGTLTFSATSSAHGYANEAAAQAVIDADPVWISGVKSTGASISIEEA